MSDPNTPGSGPGPSPTPASPPPAQKERKDEIREAVGDAAREAASELVATIKMGIKILPRPTQGIEEFGKAKPLVASAILVGLAVLVLPLTEWLVTSHRMNEFARALGGESDGPGFGVFMKMLLWQIVAAAAFWGVLFAGLKFILKSETDPVGALSLFAVTQVPFIPLVLAGWLLSYADHRLHGLAMILATSLSILYLYVALTKVQRLREDVAIYFSALGYAIWFLATTFLPR